MGTLTDYLDDYERRHPGSRERARQIADAFFAAIPETDTTALIPWSECTADHSGPAGPNEDIASCPTCWGPMGVLRPDGESFGWHIPDCSLEMRHRGYCIGGGTGHVIPDGWKIRG